MQNLAWNSYNKNSRYYFDQYNSFNFSKVHRSFSKFLPPIGANILDIGSGSGRDAFALAKRGYFVKAVEPSVAMLNLAKQNHDHERIVWIRDSLPLLDKLKDSNQKFDFILLSAVWMHISPEKRKGALKRLVGLLNDGGKIAISLRIGPTIPERFIHEVDVGSLLTLATLFGLKVVYISRSTKDSLSRDNVSWRKVVLAK